MKWVVLLPGLLASNMGRSNSLLMVGKINKQMTQVFGLLSTWGGPGKICDRARPWGLRQQMGDIPVSVSPLYMSDLQINKSVDNYFSLGDQTVNVVGLWDQFGDKLRCNNNSGSVLYNFRQEDRIAKLLRFKPASTTFQQPDLGQVM